MAVRNGGRRLALLSAPTIVVGGARMRVAALHEALGGDEACRRIELACDRWTTCRTECLATGLRRNDTRPTDWYQRTDCQAYLDALVERLEAAGTSGVICSKFDTYWYVVALAERLDVPVVFDMHNVENPLWSEIVDRTPADVIIHGGDNPGYQAWLTAAERSAVEAADEVWVCSEQDRALVEQAYGRPPDRGVRVVPNVIPAPGDGPPPDVTPTRVSFVGRLDYYPNVNAAQFLIDEVVPALAAAGFPLPVVVAGAEPNPALSDRTLPAGIRILADPDSVDEVIRGSVMAVPLWQGGGTRFKVLEAFALGAPVVSTAKGVEGLAVEHGVHYLRAETADEFAVHIRAVGRDHELRQGLAARAWDLLVSRYSVAALREQLSTRSRV